MLATLLLYAVYNEVRTEVDNLLCSTPAVGLAMDGWSRTKGGRHIFTMMACGWAFAVFVDMRSAGTEKVG